MKSIRIYCKNDGMYHDVPKGATLEEVYESLGLDLGCCVTSCKVNNRVEGLHYTINDSRDLEYLTLASPSGLRTYTRSLFFVLYKAVRDLYPEAELRIGTPVSGGYFCRTHAARRHHARGARTPAPPHGRNRGERPPLPPRHGAHH